MISIELTTEERDWIIVALKYLLNYGENKINKLPEYLGLESARRDICKTRLLIDKLRLSEIVKKENGWTDEELEKIIELVNQAITFRQTYIKKESFYYSQCERYDQEIQELLNLKHKLSKAKLGKSYRAEPIKCPKCSQPMVAVRYQRCWNSPEDFSPKMGYYDCPDCKFQIRSWQYG